MMRKRGDGFPPDQSAEHVPMPEAGFVYKLNRKYRKGFDFFRVWNITSTETDPEGRSRIELRKWSPRNKEWVESSGSGQMLLETFLKKNDKHNFIFAYGSTKDFYTDQGVPADKWSTHAIHASRDLGEPPVKDEVTEAPDPEAPEPEEEPEPLQPEEEEKPEEASGEDNGEGGKSLTTRENFEYEEQREFLEKALEEVRLLFVQEDYEHSTKTNKLTQLLGLTPDSIPPRESDTALEYGMALKNLRDHEFEHLQSSLDHIPANLRQEKIESFLLRYRYQEAATLHSLGKEVKSLGENENFFGKAKVLLQEVGNGYRQMSLKKKIAIGAGVIGLGALSGAGAGAAGLAAVAYTARRIVAGTAAYLAVDEGANAILGRREKKKAEKEAEELASEMVKTEYLSQAEKKASGEEAIPWERLLEATNEKLKSIDKDLQRLKTREKRVKLAALVGAIGLPVIASNFMDFTSSPSSISVEGEGAEATSSLPPQINTEIELPPEVDTPVLAPDVAAEDTPSDANEGADNTPASPSQEAPSADAGAETPEQREAEGYINSNTIGFGSEPLSPEEQYWQDVRDVQGNATGPYFSNASFPVGGEVFQNVPGGIPEAESPGGTYTVEMSDYRQLLQDPSLEGVNVQELQRESVTLLNQELWDIDNTEFGPDHQFTNWNMQTIERQYQGRPIGELLSFDNDHYNDPRPEYRQREWELRNRGIYLDPINPGPTLNSPPDAYAIATMDQVRDEYRHNIGDMAESAVRNFGRAALPIDTLEHRETVREYMMRIATLYTRARIENPNFRLNF